MKIVEAITAVMCSVPVVKKEDRNASQNFSFRGIDAVLNAVGPALREHGVVVTPKVISHHLEMVTVGRNQTPMQSVVVLVRYTFYGPEGDNLCVEVPGQAMDAGDKALSKAMSVAFRTALLQTLALPTDERDADADAYERAPSPERPKSDADRARDALLVKVTALGMNPGDVAQLYLTEVGTPIGEEASAARIVDFTNRLGEPK